MNDDFLKEIYEYPATGLKSKQKLYEYVKNKYPNKKITLKDIDEFMSRQKSDQLFKTVKRKLENFNPVITKKLGEINADLMDMSFYIKQNKGYKYILFVIDTYSRRVFLRALKHKTAESVLKGFDTILDEYKDIGVEISNIVCDMGKEFKNSKFEKYFSNVFKNGKIFFKDAELHNSALSICDRSMLTIRNLFKKLFVLKNNFNWIDNMYQIENNYNNTSNKGINGDTPMEIFNGKDKKQESVRVIDKLEIGDLVRIKNINTTFGKKYNTVWSDEVFVIEKLDGNGYRLSEKKRKYFFNELLKVPDNTLIHKNSVINNFVKNNKINNKLKRLNNSLN